MNSLGRWYRRGEKGLPKDPARGFIWFQRGHRLGGNSELTRNLARCYLDGKGVEKDDARGHHLFRRAAERGSECARFMLGLYYGTGMCGLPKNVYEATHWYREMESATERWGPDDRAGQDAREHAATWLRNNAADA